MVNGQLGGCLTSAAVNVLYMLFDWSTSCASVVQQHVALWAFQIHLSNQIH